MSRWPMLKLGEVCSIEKGKIGIKAATPGRFPLVTTGEGLSSHIEAHFRGEGVCIPLVSATGHGHASIKRIPYIAGEFSVGSILCVCLVKQSNKLSGRYLHYYLTKNKDSLLVPLMQGSANISLKVDDIENVAIPLPPLAEQQAIVAQLDVLEDKIQQLEALLTAAEAEMERLLAVQFHEAIKDAPYKPMTEVAPLARREVAIDLEESYTELGIRSFYKGAFHRRTLPGAEYSWQKLYWIQKDDLIFSNIMAWEQAIAIAKDEDDRCVGNHRMLTCAAKPDLGSANKKFSTIT